MSNRDLVIRIDHRVVGAAVALAAVAVPATLLAGTVTYTHSFSNGTVADAGQVNQNFADAKAAIDDNAAALGDVVDVVSNQSLAGEKTFTDNVFASMDASSQVQVRVTNTTASGGTTLMVETPNDVANSELIRADAGGETQWRVMANGKMGLGGPQPVATFDLKSQGPSTMPFRIQRSGDANSELMVEMQGDNRPWMRMYQNAVEKIRFDVGNDSFFSGQLGVGITAPTAQVHIVASSGEALRLIANDNSEPAHFSIAGDTNGARSLLSLYSSNFSQREFYFNDAGNGQADGSFGGGGADFAEFFENAERGTIEPGTVVALEQGRVRVARAGDDFVVGVVSTKPGLIGNGGPLAEARYEHPERWTLVALVGQVPVQVVGSVEHGDYLEASDRGLARRADRWHPEVLGRAMEDKHGERPGEVMTLVK